MLAYCVLIGAFSFAVFPIAWTLLTSLKPNADIVAAQIQYIPLHPTFQNYAALWAQAGFPTMFFNSAVVTVFTVLVCLFVGISGAYSLSRYRFRGRGQILLFYLVIRMFPAVLLLLPIFIALRVLGLYDTHAGLALAYTAFLSPVAIWMLKGFFDAIPPELEDAARIDGCTRRRHPPDRPAAGTSGCCCHRGVDRDFVVERVPFRADADDQPGDPDLARRLAANGRRIPASLGFVD